jgi:hypothetical protein
VPLEVQVFEGDGTRYRKPRKPLPLKWGQGRISFRVDDFPVSFEYRVGEKSQGGRVVAQDIQYVGAGNIFYANSYTYKGEPRPKGEGFTGDDGNNYHAITWKLTRQMLIDIFMHEKGDVVRARVAHRKKFRRKRI